MKTTPTTTVGLLTVREAAAYALCSPSTIKRRVREGKLTAIKFGEEGRKLFFRKEDLDKAFKNVSTPSDGRLNDIAREITKTAPELTEDAKARLKSLLSGQQS